ncbi:hypothetical protein [Levilactobacillus namurensis]|nr:hypothetical protein [Levilactobacillus namurensis]
MPAQWAGLTPHEKAVVIAGIDLRIKEEKKQKREAERKARAKRH